MADKFRTQDAPLSGRLCIEIEIPATDWYLREFLDCIRDMILDDNWEKVGSETVENAVQAATRAYWSVRKMVGQIIPYITQDAPENTLECDGAQYNRADYPELYAALDPAFIVDSDTFLVPDLRGRTLIGSGQGAGLSNRAIGDTGGEESHTLIGGEMPVHSHLDSGHIHSIHSHITGLAVAPGELPVSCPNPLPESTSAGNAAIGNAGSGNAHNNMQPFIAVKYAVVAW